MQIFKSLNLRIGHLPISNTYHYFAIKYKFCIYDIACLVSQKLCVNNSLVFVMTQFAR